MTRRTLEQNVRQGIITPQNLSKLTGISDSKIRQLCDKQIIRCVNIPGSKERRVPVTPKLIDYLSINGYQIHQLLTEAVIAYSKRYSDDSNMDSIFTEKKRETVPANPIPEIPAPIQHPTQEPAENYSPPVRVTQVLSASLPAEPSTNKDLPSTDTAHPAAA